MLVVDPGGADALARQVRGTVHAGLRQRDDRRERALHERPNRHHLDAAIALAQHLGLVRDRELGAAGGDLADRCRGVARGPDLHVQPYLFEEPLGLRRVDAGVVGVREEVEHQLELLRAARGGSLLALAAARRGGGEHAQDDEGRAPHAGSSSRLQGAASRCATVVSTNRSSAIPIRMTTPA